MTQKDTIIHELVLKKKQLLDSLLSFSIQSVLSSPNPDEATDKRAELLQMLERNDRAILTRENQTGYKASQQEQELHAEIGNLLNSIRDNNKITLASLEEAVKDSEQEKQILGRGLRIGNYVQQTRTFNKFGTKSKDIKTKRSALLNGTL